MFAAIAHPEQDVLKSLEMAAPTNAFASRAYGAYLATQNGVPYVFEYNEGASKISFLGILREGRLHKRLEIPSAPNCAPSHGVWEALQQWARKEWLTEINLLTFGSWLSTMPALGPLSHIKTRREYVLDLRPEQPFVKMRKGHKTNLSKARRAGLVLRRSASVDDCIEHAKLIDASMSRRLERGEDVTTGANMRPLLSLLETGAGVLFQALYEDQVVASNLFLLAPEGAYNHTQGANDLGFEHGAAQFVLAEAMQALRDEGRWCFNFGGTDQFGSGLEKFKTGFSKTTEVIELQAGTFGVRHRYLSALRRLIA